MIAPDWFSQELKSFRGINLYGEPQLRVVWSSDARTFLGSHKYMNPLTNKPLECFVLERFVGQGFFGSPDEWESDRYFYDDIHQTWADTKGPYPSRGMYVMVTPLATQSGEYLPLDSTMMDAVKRKIYEDEAFATASETRRGDAIARRYYDQQKIESDKTDRSQEYVREYFLTNWDRINREPSRGYSITPR